MDQECNTRIFEVAIVGGGHAGCEAALACARLGCDTVMITGSLDRIAAMSCNPAIGGVGKGHLVKEIDALGGEMARVADATGIQFRTLNQSRGPAVRATRCQSDMELYRQEMTGTVWAQDGLTIMQDDIVGLEVSDSGAIRGLKNKYGQVIRAKRVILTTGTFMGGELHLGQERRPGGRAGEAPARGLSGALKALGLDLGRLKTGTCPRLDARSIDMDVLEEQQPEEPAPRFAFESGPPPLPQISCRITHTNQRTHDVIQKAVTAGDCPLFNGQLGGAGPRYCPSVEDKVVRFPDKTSHLIFLEPQGLHTPEIYPNGLSTSLAPDVQIAFLRTLKGLEDVQVTRWGYAVEYDFIHPTQLFPTLETKSVPGLFTAGQINGTTGYEEAAAQGLLAGINAVRSLRGEEAVILPRHQAYTGVLIDDLVTLGTQEPYRMFTSRAEHRLILREDNVHARLMDVGHQIGLLDNARHQRRQAFEASVQDMISSFHQMIVPPTDACNQVLQERNSPALRSPTSFAQIIRRPEMNADGILALQAILGQETPNAATTDLFKVYRAAVELKYEGYIKRAKKEIERDLALEQEQIPDSLFQSQLPGMSNEVFEKLRLIRPKTLAQASRISGVTPAAVGLLAVEVRKKTGQAGL